VGIFLTAHPFFVIFFFCDHLKTAAYYRVIPGEQYFNLCTAYFANIYLTHFCQANIPWEDDSYAKKVSAERLHEQFMHYGVMAEVFKELKDNMQPPEACD